ncbi:MAG: hypothetical protein JO309_10390, partial [Pseudonocardiales bacterium]|nr:hypothetical protein [Pseudonocardiales bacterium]
MNVRDHSPEGRPGEGHPVGIVPRWALSSLAWHVHASEDTDQPLPINLYGVYVAAMRGVTSGKRHDHHSWELR